MLGDDALVLSDVDGQARCRAVYRSLRLFADSIDTVFDTPMPRSDVADYTDKENVHLPALLPGQADHRVAAIFFIDDDADDDLGVVSATRMSPGDTCMQLVEHSFWLDPTDMALTASKLSAASALANDVPAYLLAYPHDYAKLADVHAAIFAALDQRA